MIFRFLWLILLSMIISRSLHFAANGIISFFLWLSNIPLWIHNHTFFIYSSADGHLGYFHVLDIVNSAAVSTGMHVSFQIRVFIFFQIFAHEWDCWIIWQLNFYFILFYFFFFRESSCFSMFLYSDFSVFLFFWIRTPKIQCDIGLSSSIGIFFSLHIMDWL